jgi:hypothetical protein
MTPDAAAKEWWELAATVAETKPILARFERAEKTLKAHMKDKGLATFKGIKLESFSRGRRLDTDLLEQKVGADVVEACKTEQTAYRLLAWKRPRSTAKPAA